MKLNSKLEAKLNKKYPANTRLDEHYANLDVTIITNEEGDAVTAFVGKRREDGAIAGDRYVRRITKSADQAKVLKSHWEYKGKVSRA